jgi:inner membrane protein
MPFVSESVALDIRFGTSPRGGFTAMELERFNNRECPRHVPQWGFPREDLLAPH